MMFAKRTTATQLKIAKIAVAALLSIRLSMIAAKSQTAKQLMNPIAMAWLTDGQRWLACEECFGGKTESEGRFVVEENLEKSAYAQELSGGSISNTWWGNCVCWVL